MAILKVTASKDNTIANAYEANFIIRGTGSNMGASDILEVFSIYAQQNSSSVELARTLVEFPLSKISSERASGNLPVSGSVKFFLKLYNAPHTEPVPENFDLYVLPISQSWQEGRGLDMVEYSDLTFDKEGSNWINNASGSTWTTQGGDYLYSYAITSSFVEGTEDLVQDVTSIVEDWLIGSSGGKYDNYGFGVILKTSHEQEERSFFTKKFFARNTEFYYKRPCLEARWDDSLKDSRGSFYASSSIQAASDNINVVYLYNRVRGVLKDYPAGKVPTSASFRTSPSDSSTEIVKFPVSKVPNTTGIYKVEAHVNTTASTIYDVWSSGSVTYHTGTIKVNNYGATVLDESSKYVVSIVNNDHNYNTKQKARFKLYTRLKNWSPNLYTVAQNSPENLIIEDAIYKIYRVSDGEEIIPYGSGSTKFTQLSYNVSGNYFDLDMSLFETGYEYGIKLSFYDDYLNSYKEQPYVFKFKVVE